MPEHGIEETEDVDAEEMKYLVPKAQSMEHLLVQVKELKRLFKERIEVQEDSGTQYLDDDRPSGAV